MEVCMNGFRRMVFITMLISSLCLTGITTARAQALEVVFRDSLWGAAIGGVSGLATWALQDKDKEDKLFPKYINKGAAFGFFVGMAFGVYDSHKGGDVFMSQGFRPKGLIHYNDDRALFTIRPAQILLQNQQSLLAQRNIQLNLFSAEF